MSGMFRPRNLLIAGGAGAVAFALLPKSEKTPVNPFNTPAVQNVTDRYSSGGGSDNHLPGMATERGNAEKTTSNQVSPKGVGTPHFQENVAAQKVGEPGAVGKAFNETQLGSSKGK